MATLKLKSNILELVCRTCLKMNKTRLNMYQCSQNQKLISDIIMECTPIKVHKNDGFPENICSNCIEELNVTFKFIMMVMQSDTKLKNFYECKSTLDKETQSHFKQKASFIKTEDVKSPLDSVESNITVTHETMGLPLVNYTCVKNKGDSVDVKKETIIEPSYWNNNKEDKILSVHETSNELGNFSNDDQINSSNSNNRIICSENEVGQKALTNTEDICSTVCDIQKLENCQKESINEDAAHNDKLPHDEAVTRSKNQSKKHKGVIKQMNANIGSNKRRCKQVNSDRNVNEKQAELLDNPDYKRIMQMGLSKKEKARQLVVCRECNKTFNFQYFVGVHAHLHTGNLPFKCDKCSMCFPKKPMLNKHSRAHIETKDFSCEECGKAFTTIYLLRLHKIVHSNERPYKCDICGKAFKHSPALRIHIKTHNNIKDHICEVCGKTFVNLSNLHNHRVMHTVSDEKNFECKICGKKFSLKRGLDEHTKRHSGKKPCVCSHCGKSFQNNFILRQHSMIHTGEKPHACELCDKRFRHRSCIVRHMRIHTGETPFPCNLCASAFKYKHHLLNHIKVHHENESM